MSAAELLARLGDEAQAWQALHTTLIEEEQALTAGEADRLSKLNAAKLMQLQAVSDLARARQAKLLAAGHSGDRTGMDAWLAQFGLPELKTRWQQLGELERETQAANQRVGALIELRLGATRQALNVLLHAASSQNGGLYDPDGLAVSGVGGKPLTAA